MAKTESHATKGDFSLVLKDGAEAVDTKPTPGFVTYECDCTHDLGEGRKVKNRVVNEVEDVANPPDVVCDGCKKLMRVVEGAA